ncbi:MAG: hypothetical protein Q9183_002068 [Haloplaca sp. 2 TL-2023]
MSQILESIGIPSINSASPPTTATSPDAKMAVSQASDGLGDPKLLQVIDKLVELNIGESVALPQLVVVGDQSSGKSSVLEGLTGLPFPRDSTLCTRFATQITFKRASITSINVSIIPDKSTTQDEADRLRSWKKTGLTSLSRHDFSKILDEVHDAMGIGESASGKKKSFSDDVLKIELAGPSQQHLSVVDVPGIFRKVTDGVTTSTDIVNVRAMVERYMANSRSIILPVIPANVDIANQEILDMAEKHDSDGQRTLGVLTKPDLVDRGAEQGILDIMQGISHKLNLGWCMVRNPGQQDVKKDDFDRHASEKAFFKNNSPWTKLDKDRVGVDSLRLRLVELLTEIVRREFNGVRANVIQNLKSSEKKLELLGPCRETKEQQQKYLLDLATRFQSMTSQALGAEYDSVFRSKESLKLATLVVKRDDCFAEDVWRKGHTMEFHRETPESLVQDEMFVMPIEEEPPAGTFSTRQYDDAQDLDDILKGPQDLTLPANGIMAWLKEVYEGSRGFELGTFNSSLVTIVWREQSEKWKQMALGYTSDVVTITHTYIRDLLREICVDDRVRAGVMSALMDHLSERYKRAMESTEVLLECEQDPLTFNHYFAQNMEKCLQKRMKATMSEPRVMHSQKWGEIIEKSAIDQAMARKSNLDNTIQQLHDILESYYKVARKRFVDNICMQVTDRHLMRGRDTAVRVFSPNFVTDLTPAQMDQIAGEDVLTKRKRAELTREIENLRAAKKLLVMG